MKKALVISGGGAKGAYAVGVLNFLKKSRPDFFSNGRFLFDLYLGTSTGSLVVPLASIGDMDQLIKFYTGVNTGNLIVIHDALTFLSTGSLFNSFKLDTLIDTVFNTTRFNQIISQQVGLTAVCLQTGELRIFSTKPLAANPPHYTTQTIASRNDLVDAILASSHQPFFFQPVRIRSAPATPARHFVDGGVREYAAVQVALDAGADEVLAILLAPETPAPVNDLDVNDVISVLQRTIDIFSDDVDLNDVRVPDILSRGANYVAAVRAAMQAANLPAAQIEAFLNPPKQPNPFKTGQSVVFTSSAPKRPWGAVRAAYDSIPLKCRPCWPGAKRMLKAIFRNWMRIRAFHQLCWPDWPSAPLAHRITKPVRTAHSASPTRVFTFSRSNRASR